MALPPLTPEQRSAALEKAAQARRERASVKNRLKYAQGDLGEVITEGKQNDVIGKMRVSALLAYLNAAMPPDKHEEFDTAEVARAVGALAGRGRVVFEGDVLRIVGGDGGAV